uniref:Uncharacterized protein n=1 Tax=Arundo donax TaxID=35708 RepID=A0A0A9HRR0_ARUDO
MPSHKAFFTMSMGNPLSLSLSHTHTHTRGQDPTILESARRTTI